MATTPDPDLLFVAAGEGRPVDRLHGERTTIVAGRSDTRDAYAVRENTAPPGFASVPLHIHRDAEEAFYVLSGILAVQAGDRRVDAAAGSFALIPRGLVHSLANPGTDPVRWLTLISPAEQSEWIEAEHALLHSSSGDPAPEALAAIHRRFGLEIVGPPPW
jgi:mannose-6-phosphate isomerase-like protein (cupin superfamily)